MFDGKKKAVTFSYDDAVTQDIRLIEMFDKYGVKGTFNLNSEWLGIEAYIDVYGKRVTHFKNKAKDIAKIYKNHEIAVHTLTHENLTNLSDSEVIRQVEQDRLNLSELAGYEVTGMAYPCGGTNNDDRVAGLIKDRTGIKFARTITSNYCFDLQKNLYRFNPTVHSFGNDGFEKMKELAQKFLESDSEEPKIWGHSYEFDVFDEWGKMEEFLKYISGRDDVFYGTNSQVLLDN